MEVFIYYLKIFVRDVDSGFMNIIIYNVELVWDLSVLVNVFDVDWVLVIVFNKKKIIVNLDGKFIVIRYYVVN